MSDISQIENLIPASLKPHPANSRLHSESQITAIVASIEQFGFNGAITIDEDGVILAGHGRWMAAQRMGRETIPCVRRTGLSDAQKRAFVIADNKIGLDSDWDAHQLASELESLQTSGLDLDSLGISALALSSITTSGPPKPDEVRALEEKTDSAPVSDQQFELEMTQERAAALLPIVPIYAEHHTAFVIVCDNEIDEAWLRNRLGLEKKHQSGMNEKLGLSHVISIADFRARMS